LQKMENAVENVALAGFWSVAFEFGVNVLLT
jgi:hypothetical protein